MKSDPRRTGNRRWLVLLPVGLAAAITLAAAAPSQAPQGVSVEPVTQQALPNAPGNELTAAVVRFAPGASTPAHHHAGFVFAYVLSGTVRSSLNGGAPVDYRAGQSWVEPPGTEHTLSANPSRTEAASLLAVFVAPAGATLTTYNK